MALTVTTIVVTVVTCILVAAVTVVVASYVILTLIELARRRQTMSPLDQTDAEYQATRRAMNDAANQSWRNLID